MRDELEAGAKSRQRDAKEAAPCGAAQLLGAYKRRTLSTPPTKWKPACRAKCSAKLREQADQLSAGFHIHPKLKKLLEQRSEMAHGKRAVDYGMAEALAFGIAAACGTPVRFSGQEVGAAPSISGTRR